MDLDTRRSFFDPTGEELTADTFLTACANDLADRLPLHARPVDGPFARDDEVGAVHTGTKTDLLEDDLRAGHELSTERRDRGTQASRRTRPGQVRVGPKPLARSETLLERLDLLRRSTLLGPEG